MKKFVKIAPREMLAPWEDGDLPWRGEGLDGDRRK